jgi:diguanylate cyclase (GGDEF)-like protein
MSTASDGRSTKESPPSAAGFLGADDVLAPYRARVMYWLGILGVVVLLPLGVNDFLRGLSAVGVAVVALVLILGMNAFAVHRGKQPPVPLGLLVMMGIVTIGVSIRSQGIYGVLWSYPAVLFFYFCFSRRAATIYNVILCALVTVMIHNYMDTGTTVRFVITMLVVIISSNVFIGIISSLQLELLEQSIVDPLTGAFNRRHMEASLGDAVERKRRNPAHASLLLIDIDHFKQINDDLGHSAGDEVLKSVVALIKDRSRRIDLLFRMGGEEFVLLLPDTNEADAAVVAEHLRAGVEQSRMLDDRRVSVSVGVSELRAEESVDAWVKEADVALYRAKRTGRNRVVSRGDAVSAVQPGQGCV